jgi:hypothetical protein
MVAGATPPVIAVKRAPRLSCDCLDHHPVRALEACLGKQVLDPDLVPSPRARYAPCDVIESHLDPAVYPYPNQLIESGNLHVTRRRGNKLPPFFSASSFSLGLIFSSLP